MTCLRLENISVSLGQEPIINSMSFEAKPGELTVVCGPNGAGKSTLLRAVSGLLPLHAGDIFWGDKKLSGLAAHAIGEHVAYLPQGQVIHWPLDVESIVRLGRQSYLQPFAKPSPEDEAAVVAALEKTGMTAFRSRPVTQLSGGECARALLARLLASDASVYLVDEPLAALDPYYQMSVLHVLRQCAEEGKCVVTVVHDLSIARRYFDAAYLLKDGQVLQHGPTEQVLSPEAIKQAYDIDVEVTNNGGIEAIARS